MLYYNKEETFINFLKKHQSLFRWIIFSVNIIFLLFIIKEYINYGNIEQAIIRERNETKNIKNHIYYLNNFEKKYLQSEYAPYLLGHKNKRLFNKEFLIYFVEKDKIKNNSNKEKVIIKKTEKNTPLKQWEKLIKEKTSYILK